MNKVALYLRKSREDDELKDETLSRHEQMLNEYCAKNNLYIVKTYKEIVSGESISNRPQMQELMKEVALGKYDGVVCIEIERLSRGNPIDQMEILEVFKSSGTKIYTLQKVYDLTKEDIDEEYFEFALFMSRREYKTITRRMLRGRHQAVHEGYFIGSQTPYGYTKERQDKGFVLIPDPKEANIVKYIFEQYASGNGVDAIAKDLNKKGIMSKSGGLWSGTVIARFLYNKTYLGQLRTSLQDSNWVPGKHVGIIPQDLFDKVQLIRSQHRPRNTKNLKLKNSFAGLVKCGFCGCSIQRHLSHYQDYLICYNSKKTYCPNKGINYLKFEKIVLEELKNTLKDFNYFLDNSAAELELKKESKKNELNILNAELTSKQKQIDKICSLLEQGIYSIDIFNSRTNAINESITNIKKRIEELESIDVDDDIKIKTAIPILEKVLDKYDELEPEQKNKLLKALIKDIYVKKIGKELKVDINLLV